MLSHTIKHRFEEFLVLFLIFLNVFDFFKLLSTDIDFIKKIMSLMIIGYLIYHISITKQIFGIRREGIDVFILAGFFMMILRYFIEFSKEVSGSNLMNSLYRFILVNERLLGFHLLYIGFMSIILISIYLGFTQDTKKPNLLDIIKGGKRFLDLKPIRSIIIFLSFISFFLLVFIPMVEWIGLAIDSSIIIVAIIFYALTAFRRHHKRLNKDYYLFKIGSFGEKFYEDFISLLHSKKGILLIASGIICLHVLSDVGNYIVPYLLGVEDFMYLKNFDSLHQPFSIILFDSLSKGGFILLFETIIFYALNLIGIIALLALPSYIWYRFYKRKRFSLDNITLTTIIVSLISLVHTPLFYFSQIDSKDFIGIEIQSYNVHTDIINNLISLSFYILIASVIYLLIKKKSIHRYFTSSLMLISNVFLICYTYVFFIQNVKYYSDMIILLSHGPMVILSLIMGLFLMITSLFYILGVLIFSYENFQEMKTVD